MHKHYQSIIIDATGAKAIFEIEEIQSLWSGYGKIVRYGLKDGSMTSVVVKHMGFQPKAGQQVCSREWC